MQRVFPDIYYSAPMQNAFDQLSPLDTVRLLSVRLATERTVDVVRRVAVQFTDLKNQDIEFEVRKLDYDFEVMILFRRFY
jgi:hypothetical protein